MDLTVPRTWKGIWLTQKINSTTSFMTRSSDVSNATRHPSTLKFMILPGHGLS